MAFVYGLPFPTNVLDQYVENIVAINGNTAVWPPQDEKNRKGRPGLLDALKLHGLPESGRSKEEKERIRRIILDNEQTQQVERKRKRKRKREKEREKEDKKGPYVLLIDRPCVAD